MLRFLKLLFLAPIAVLLVLLGVANRQVIAVNLDPFATGAVLPQIPMPLFVFFFATLAVGIVIGYVAAWLAQGSHRKAERQLRRECARLNGECDRLKAQVPTVSLATLARN